MEQTVQFNDGLRATLQHRSFGTFRTIVANEHGSISRDYNTSHDSRHVSVYRSPTGRLVLADYGTIPFIIEKDADGLLRLVSRSVLKQEYLISQRWNYLGSVHRTEANSLEFFPHDEECQEFDDYYVGPSTRKVERCQNANYTSG